jgi:hypothetical protein
MDQLERRYCKDTPFFRPFYIGAPKGPFLPGLTMNSFSLSWKSEVESTKNTQGKSQS